MIFDALVGGFVRSNGWRALVSIAAIAFGVATALALALTNAQTIRSLDYDRDLFGQHVDFQVLPFGTRLPQAVLARVRYLAGVAGAMPIIDRPVTIGVDRSGAGGDAARIVGVDLVQPLPGVSGFDEGRPGPFARAGSFVDPAESIGTDGAIVSSATATRLALRRGASFAVLIGARIVRLRVANVMPPSATGVDSSVVFVDIASAQKILNQLGSVDRIDVVAAASPQTVRSRLAAAIGSAARVVVPAPTDVSLGSLTNALAATFGALASIGLAVGGLLVFSAVGTSIAYRRGDIGTLRALGVTRASIVAAFVGEGIAYGAIGGLLGAALAEFAVDFATRVAGSKQDLGAYGPWTAALAVILGIGIAVVSSLAPALSAARIAPALAARRGGFEGAKTRSDGLAARAFLGVGALALGVTLASSPANGVWFVLGFPLCFATGILLIVLPFWRAIGILVRRASQNAPPSLHLAGLTLSAIPKRIAVAVAALSIAVFAAVAFDVASDSFANALHAWVKNGPAGDILVRPSGYGGTFDAGVVARVRATPGVTSVNAIRTIHTQVGSDEVDVRGEDAMAPRPTTTEPPAELGAPLAAALQIRSGDVIVLRGARHDVRVRVSDIRPDFSAGRGAIVIARRVLRDTFDDDRIDALRLTIARTSNPVSVENAVVRKLAPQRIVAVTTRELRDRFTSVFDATFAFVGTLAAAIVAIASLGLASALSALIFERRVEFQLLRIVGASRRTIARMLVTEALAVALSGCALGAVFGIAFAAVQSYVTDPVAIGFAIPLTVPFASLALIVATAILGTSIAPLLTARAAFRMQADRSA
jgi:putative ABC transport system permease protein